MSGEDGDAVIDATRDAFKAAVSNRMPDLDVAKICSDWGRCPVQAGTGNAYAAILQSNELAE